MTGGFIVKDMVKEMKLIFITCHYTNDVRNRVSARCHEHGIKFDVKWGKIIEYQMTKPWEKSDFVVYNDVEPRFCAQKIMKIASTCKL